MTPTVRHYTKLFRTERPDRPILDCYWAARSFSYFRESLRKTVATSNKRSRAAKEAWKRRKVADQ